MVETRTRKVRFIGGFRDGEWCDLPFNRYEWQVAKATQLSVADFEADFEDPAMVEIMIYTLRYLQGPLLWNTGRAMAPYNNRGQHWKMEFLAPYDWPDSKAIEHQFNK